MATSRCKNCVHFYRGVQGKLGSCELVAGSIDPEYWCKKFRRSK
jgi:hypothetical protein